MLAHGMYRHLLLRSLKFHIPPHGVPFTHRFTPEEKAKRHPCAYMPFGYGPRNCIGMRFALMEVKMALIEILSQFRMVLSPETKVRFTLALVFPV